MLRGISAALAALLLILIILGGVWSCTPNTLRLDEGARSSAQPAGLASTQMLIRVGETLLEKPGGYISNDVTPPAWWLDNIQNWEFGVLVQLRDYTRVLRNEISRSQSQSTEDPALGRAEPYFNVHNDSWLFPAAESEYRKGLAELAEYAERLAEPVPQAQFHARADNLVDWLRVVEKRLGSLVQRLGMSVGKQLTPPVTSDRAEAVAAAAFVSDSRVPVAEESQQTPWLQIDDIFFEARGAAWALLALSRAAEVDFANVLADKNAVLSFRQVIRELEAANQDLSTPMILNGGGFSLWPNHSLVMASYLGSANSAVANLIVLLEKG